MLTQKGNIIFTFDDIIVDSSYILYIHLINNFTTYSKYLNIYKLYNKKEIYKRNNKDLISYLFKSELLNNKYINNMFNNLYLNLLNKYYSQDIYSYIKPTKLATSTLMNPLFVENQGIENIYIIVKYRIDEERKYKEQFIKSYFNNVKVHPIYINEEDDYINAFNQIKKWNLVVTDDIKLIEALSSKDIDHKEFLLLRCGYNVVPSELKYLIREKNANITLYDN